MRVTFLFFWESYFTNTLIFKVCTCSWGGLHQCPSERRKVFPQAFLTVRGLYSLCLMGDSRLLSRYLLCCQCLFNTKSPPTSCLVVWLMISWGIQNLTDNSYDILVSCCPFQVSAWASEFYKNLNKLLHMSNILLSCPHNWYLQQASML